MRKLLVALGLALTLTSCATLTGPSDHWVRVFHAERLVPEVWWEVVFTSVVMCAQEVYGTREGVSFADIEWYLVPHGNMLAPNGEIWAGLFSPPNRIYLDERWVMDVYILAHELMHYATGVGHGQPEVQLEEDVEEQRWLMLELSCLR